MGRGSCSTDNPWPVPPHLRAVQAGPGREWAEPGAGVEPWPPGPCTGTAGGPAGQGTADPRPGAPGPATTTPQSRSVPRLSVHGADINGPNRQRAQRESLECCGFSPAHIAGAGLMSASWTPTPHQAASKWPTPASSTTNPPRIHARASTSEVRRQHRRSGSLCCLMTSESFGCHDI